MNMPTEGQLTAEETVRGNLRTDVPTCGLDQNLQDAMRLASGWKFCIVINKARVVLGLLNLESAADKEGTVEEHMKPAPLTIRPGASMNETLAYLAEAKTKYVLVTKSSGELIGVITRDGSGVMS